MGKPYGLSLMPSELLLITQGTLAAIPALQCGHAQSLPSCLVWVCPLVQVILVSGELSVLAFA